MAVFLAKREFFEAVFKVFLATLYFPQPTASVGVVGKFTVVGKSGAAN